MSSALDMLHAARRAWENTQPQYQFDLDGLLDELPDVRSNVIAATTSPVVVERTASGYSPSGSSSNSQPVNRSPKGTIR